MKDLENLRKIFEEFGDRAVELAKSNLNISRTIDGKKRRRYASGKLRDSLTYSFWRRGTSDFIIFTTNSKATREYADVIEEGRRPYPNDPSKTPPYEAILEWIRIKKIRFRNVDAKNVMQKSQFKAKSREPKTAEAEMKSMAIRMAKSINAKGIKGIHYFKEAVEDAFDEFDEKIVDALIKDIDMRLKSDKFI